MKTKRKTVMIGVEQLAPDPDQPRKTFSGDGIENMASSLVEIGQLVPIVVTPGQRRQYVIIAGERRWLAAKHAGMPKVECIVLRDLNDQQVREAQFAENCNREDVPPLELGRSLKEYFEAHPDVSQSALSRRIGLPQRTISARLTLASLPESVQAEIEAGRIGPHEATRIAALPAQIQDTVAKAVASGRMKGGKLDKLIKQARDHPEMTAGDIMEGLERKKDTSVSQTRMVDAPLPALAPETREDMADSPNVEDERRQIGQTQFSLSVAQAPSDADIQLAMARLLRLDIEKQCLFLEEGNCSFWSWGIQDSVPEAIGDLVDMGGQRRLRPSPLCCAMCVIVLRLRMDQLGAKPLPEETKSPECVCGQVLEMAHALRCESCGHEVCFCWWPKASIRAITPLS
ncbi:ParB/RepB/Spo0J family partition protein [Chloroflexota bacterium]